MYVTLSNMQTHQTKPAKDKNTSMHVIWRNTSSEDSRSDSIDRNVDVLLLLNYNSQSVN